MSRVSEAVLQKCDLSKPENYADPLAWKEAWEKARIMYWAGHQAKDIAAALGVKYTNVRSWIRRGHWVRTPARMRIDEAVTARVVRLILKDAKTPADYAEMDTILKWQEKLIRLELFATSGKEGDLQPAYKERARKGAEETNRRKKASKNLVTEDAAQKIERAFHSGLFGYQKDWLAAGDNRTRVILKSRQIGATWYFAREALMDGLATGRNQIFLSASRAQAEVFRSYIRDFVSEAAGVKFEGNPIEVQGPAGKFSLFFLSTNAKTAQSYHGNLYLDEFFWIGDFANIRKVASGMAMHKKWRLTYFSTPSTMSHAAYPFWTGADTKAKRADPIDVSHQALARGRLCEDRRWRQIVTVEDAAASGCDLFDLDELRAEYSDSEFRNLLMAEFVDDTDSVFGFEDLLRCQVDSWEAWADFRPFAERPLAGRPVWLGYDPSRLSDGASVIVVAPPATAGAPYRCVHKDTWRGLPFTEQADRIKRLCTAYNVEYMGVDCSGSGGLAVYDLIKPFYPSVTQIVYNTTVKSRMVAKARNIITRGLLQYDADWKDLTMALLAIRETMTATGHTTYSSGRTEESGHADLAWALLHALDRTQITEDGRRHGALLEVL